MCLTGILSVDGRTSSARFLARPLLGLLLVGFAVPAESAVSYLSNRTIKIGVDLDKGGAITYLAHLRRNTNVVNNFDLGRQIQQSYYSGPQPFDPYNNMKANWESWPWNPIQSGDSYGHPGRVLQSRNDGKEIYVKSRPMQWALNDVPGDQPGDTGGNRRAARAESPAAADRGALADCGPGDDGAGNQHLAAAQSSASAAGRHERSRPWDFPASVSAEPPESAGRTLIDSRTAASAIVSGSILAF